jgi:hypothetical protein
MRPLYFVDSWFFIAANDHHFRQEGFTVVSE